MCKVNPSRDTVKRWESGFMKMRVFGIWPEVLTHTGIPTCREPHPVTTDTFEGHIEVTAG